MPHSGTTPGTANMRRLKPHVVTRLLQARRLGSSIQDCCRFAGLSNTTYYDWIRAADEALARGEDGRLVREMRRTPMPDGSHRMDPVVTGFDGNPFVAVKHAFAEAEAQHTLHHLGNIHRAGRDDWRASAHALAVKDPESYGKKNRLSVDGRIEADVHVDGKVEVSLEGLFEKVSDETLAAVLVALGLKAGAEQVADG